MRYWTMRMRRQKSSVGVRVHAPATLSLARDA